MEKLLLLCPGLLFCLINSVTTRFSRKKFGYAIPFTMVMAVMLMYLSQLFCHSWQPGFVLLLLMALIGLLLLLGDVRNRADFFSEGLVAFIVVCMITGLLCLRRWLTDFDEFWCWGVMVKESLRLDSFYCVPASRLIVHRDYPPFPAIAELLWAKLAGGYSEGTVIMAMVVESLTLTVVPLFEKLSEPEHAKCRVGEKKHWIRAAVSALLLTLFIMLVISAFDVKHVFFTILVDVPLAAIFAFGVVYILSGEAFSRFGLVTLSLAGAMMVMTKQPGLALLPVWWLLYLVWETPAPGPRRRKRVLGSFLILVIPLMIFSSWSLYEKSQMIYQVGVSSKERGQFNPAKINAQAYFDAVLKRGSVLRTTTFWNLIRAFFTEPVSNMSWPVLTFVSSVCMLLLVILGFSRSCSEVFDRRKTRFAVVALVFMAAGYAFMMSVMFVFFFGDDEMAELRGYVRYVDIFILCVVLVLVPVGLLLMKKKGSRMRMTSQLAAVLIAVVALNNSAVVDFFPHHPLKYIPYETVANRILETTEPGSSITITYDTEHGDFGGWYGSLQSIVYYFAEERDILWGMDLFDAEYTQEEERIQALNQIRESDYLYVVDLNEELEEFLTTYIDGTEACSDTIYRVEKAGDGIMLHEMD